MQCALVISYVIAFSELFIPCQELPQKWSASLEANAQGTTATPTLRIFCYQLLGPPF